MAIANNGKPMSLIMVMFEPDNDSDNTTPNK